MSHHIGKRACMMYVRTRKNEKEGLQGIAGDQRATNTKTNKNTKSPQTSFARRRVHLQQCMNDNPHNSIQLPTACVMRSCRWGPCKVARPHAKQIPNASSFSPARTCMHTHHSTVRDMSATQQTQRKSYSTACAPLHRHLLHVKHVVSNDKSYRYSSSSCKSCCCTSRGHAAHCHSPYPRHRDHKIDSRRWPSCAW